MVKMGKALVAALGLLAVAAAPSAPAWAGDSNGNFQVKVGISGVLTDDHTQSLVLHDGGTTDLLALGEHATVDDIVIPTLTLTYYLNRNIGLELFCCFAEASVKGVGPYSGEIAQAWLFPPALTLQYHFDGFGAFRPYVGAGAEWIHYFGEGTGDNVLGATTVKFEDSFGPVLQAGFDYDLGGGWSLGFDFKKVWLDTKITWTDTAAAPGSNTVVASHDLDPIIVTANLGYRFNLSDLFGPRSAPTPLK